jgi:hypothetical protein
MSPTSFAVLMLQFPPEIQAELMKELAKKPGEVN